LALLACLLLELPKPLRPAQLVLATDRPGPAQDILESLCGLLEKRRIIVTTPGDKHDGADRALYWDTPVGLSTTDRRDGLTIEVDLGGPVPKIHQYIHSDRHTTRLDLSDHIPQTGHQTITTGALPYPNGENRSPATEAPVPLRRLLLAERHHQNAWRERPQGRQEALVKQAVEHLFAHGPLGSHTPSHRRARLLFHLGYLEQLTATRSGAAALYQASLQECPSAEAWTFMGWLHAQNGDLDAAIHACHNAIHTDPGLGNPYNDIGAYLFALGDNKQAKIWLRRSLCAQRYLAPHYPHTNLARIHLQEGDLRAARRAAEHALENRRDYTPARRLLDQIQTQTDPTG
jgi:hypothetical protein